MAVRIKDTSIMKFMILILIFVVLNFNRDLGLVYSIMIVADFIWWFFDNKFGNKIVDLPIDRGISSWRKTFLEAGIAYLLFIMVASVLYGVFGSSGSALQSIIKLLSSTTPILKGSVFLTVIGWGVLIPIVETKFFFGSLVEGLANEAQVSGTKIPLNKFAPSSLVLAALVSSLFALFHISAKALDNTSLMVTFLFGMVSMVLILRNRELKQAILLHIISNTVATMAALGLIFSTVGAA